MLIIRSIKYTLFWQLNLVIILDDISMVLRFLHSATTVEVPLNSANLAAHLAYICKLMAAMSSTRTTCELRLPWSASLSTSRAGHDMHIVTVGRHHVTSRLRKLIRPRANSTEWLPSDTKPTDVDPLRPTLLTSTLPTHLSDSPKPHHDVLCTSMSQDRLMHTQTAPLSKHEDTQQHVAHHRINPHLLCIPNNQSLTHSRASIHRPDVRRDVECSDEPV